MSTENQSVVENTKEGSFGIPAGVIRSNADIPIGEIFADYKRNFRQEAFGDYSDCLPTKGFDETKWKAGIQAAGTYESILYYGIKTPVMVSKLSADERERVYKETGIRYLFRVIRGHRRYRIATNIRTAYPDRMALIPCLVLEGLTVDDEWSLLADHSKAEQEHPLSEVAIYFAAVSLYGHGFSQEAIGRMLGGNSRGWAQRKINLYRMRNDTPVEQVYLAQHAPNAPEGTLRLPLGRVDKLFPLWNADREAGKKPMDADSQFRTGKDGWDDYMGKGNRRVVEPKAKTFTDISGRKTCIEGRGALEELMNFCLDVPNASAQTAADMYDIVHKKAETAEALAVELTGVKAELDRLQADFKLLGEELETEVSANKALETERNELIAQCKTLADENNTLRSAVKAKNGK